MLEEEMDNEGTKSEEGGEGDVEGSKRFKKVQGPKKVQGQPATDSLQQILNGTNAQLFIFLVKSSDAGHQLDSWPLH